LSGTFYFSVNGCLVVRPVLVSTRTDSERCALTIISNNCFIRRRPDIFIKLHRLGMRVGGKN
jgi:hypothetical protein